MTASAPINDAPDWATLALELHCPRCGYDLRLLPQARCPECGLKFQWSELIAAAERRSQGVLFDEQWPEGCVRAFFGTLVRTLPPLRLWRQRRLDTCPARKALITLALALAVFYSGAWFVTHVVWYVFTAVWFWGVGRLTWGPGQFRALSMLADSAEKTAFLIVMGSAVWLATLGLWRTLRRAPVRPMQVARVVLLAWAGMLGWRLIVEWVFLLGSMVNWLLRGSAILDPWSWPIASFVPLVVFVWSLAGGFRIYLRLRGAWADALLALGLAFALMLAGWLAIGVYVYDDLLNPFTAVAESVWPGPTSAVEWLVSMCTRH
jgi:hypothetical protein